MKIIGSWTLYLRPTWDARSDAVRAPHEELFTASNFMWMVNNAATVTAWDWNSALGDTVMEKYESLYVKLYETTNVVWNKIRKPAVFWIACCKDVLSIFETATLGWVCKQNNTSCGPHWKTSYLKSGPPIVQYKGTINNRWYIYSGPYVPAGKVIIGCGNEIMAPEHYAKLSVCNFII